MLASIKPGLVIVLAALVTELAIAAERDTSATLAREVKSMLAGTPIFSDLEAPLAQRVRDQWPSVWPRLQQFGSLQSIKYQESVPDGDFYLVTCEHATTRWLIFLSSSGKVQTLRFFPVEAAGQQY